MINITPIQVSSRINARKKKSSNTLYSEELKSFCEKKVLKRFSKVLAWRFSFTHDLNLK